MNPQEVQQRVDAYRPNPAMLQQKYAMSQDLLDLLALQQLNKERQEMERQKAMQAGGAPATVSDQIKMKAAQMSQPQMAPQRQPLPEEQGVATLPAQNMETIGMAEGGIVGYAGGGNDYLNEPEGSGIAYHWPGPSAERDRLNRLPLDTLKAWWNSLTGDERLQWNRVGKEKQVQAAAEWAREVRGPSPEMKEQPPAPPEKSGIANLLPEQKPAPRAQEPRAAAPAAAQPTAPTPENDVRSKLAAYYGQQMGTDAGALAKTRAAEYEAAYGKPQRELLESRGKEISGLQQLYEQQKQRQLEATQSSTPDWLDYLQRAAASQGTGMQRLSAAGVSQREAQAARAQKQADIERQYLADYTKLMDANYTRKQAVVELNKAGYDVKNAAEADARARQAAGATGMGQIMTSDVTREGHEMQAASSKYSADQHYRAAMGNIRAAEARQDRAEKQMVVDGIKSSLASIDKELTKYAGGVLMPKDKELVASLRAEKEGLNKALLEASGASKIMPKGPGATSAPALKYNPATGKIE